jgi:hypothetical protein
MVYRIFAIVVIIFISSCKEKNSSVKIIGVVTDEVTGVPVTGASVALEIYFCEDGRCYSESIPGTTVITGNDGSYIIDYIYNEDDPYLFKEQAYHFPSAFYTFAWKSGYVTSDLHPLMDKNYKDAGLKLYHSAQLNVHAKNAGINNLKAAILCVDRGYGLSAFSTPEFTLLCKGISLDTVFILKNLWGDFNYDYKVIPYPGPIYAPSVMAHSPLFMKPDTITDLYISF